MFPCNKSRPHTWARLNGRVLTATILFIFCNGCSDQQWVKEKYPLWGDEIHLQKQGKEESLHMQLLSSSTVDKTLGCLLMVHGMNEYIGRYGYLARHFADRFIVAGVDLTGHGLTNPVLLRGHQSITNGNNQYDVSDAYLEQALLDDLDPMRDDLTQALGFLINHCDRITGDDSLPVFILSHSLGSLVSASYLLQSPNNPNSARIKGIIFSGPAFSVTRVPGWKGWLQNPFIWFTFHTHEHFLNPHNEPLPILLFNQLLALITVPLQDIMIEMCSLPGARTLFSPSTPAWVVEHLSDWEEERERHRADNYIIRRSILRYVLGVEKEIIQFRNQMKQFNIPYLLIYSENDPITPAWGNTDFAALTLNKHRHNELMLLPGKNHHEQLFSTPPLRRRILQKIDSWLQQRLEQTEGQ